MKWELILINDGSKDATQEIAQRFAQADKRITVIRTENGGVCSARNIGIEASKGEYITFLDADDELLPNSLEVLHTLIDDKYDIAIGQKIVEQLDGTITSFSFPEQHCIWTGTEGLYNSLEDHPALYSSCGKLYKKSALGAVRFVKGKKIHEDSYFLFECMLEQPSVVISDTCVLKVNYTLDSVSRGKFSDKFFDIVYFANRKELCIERLYPEFDYKIPNLTIKANMALLHALSNQISVKYLKAECSSINIVISNKNNFKCAIKDDNKWFWIITHHLYFPYKFFHILQRKIRKLRSKG